MLCFIFIIFIKFEAWCKILNFEEQTHEFIELKLIIIRIKLNQNFTLILKRLIWWVIISHGSFTLQYMLEIEGADRSNFLQIQLLYILYSFFCPVPVQCICPTPYVNYLCTCLVSLILFIFVIFIHGKIKDIWDTRLLINN